MRRGSGDDPRRRRGWPAWHREIREVVETLRPERIGRRILAAQDEALMEQIRRRRDPLEICPTSNLLTKALPDEDAVRETFRAFTDNGVPLHDRHRRSGDDEDPCVTSSSCSSGSARSTARG